MGLRSQQLDGDVISRTILQSECGFESSDASAGDEDSPFAIVLLAVALHRTPPVVSIQHAPIPPTGRSRKHVFRLGVSTDLLSFGQIYRPRRPWIEEPRIEQRAQ